MDAATAFQPLKPGRPVAPTPMEPEFVPLVPPTGSEPPAVHPKLGRYGHRWPYFSADGALEGYVCRFDLPDGKEFRPLRYGRLDGRESWHWKGWGEGRPLYRLPELLAEPEAPVLVVEGEKAADAAAAAFPTWAVVSPMNGARSPRKTDWSVVVGREVTIWPDADEPGRDFARAVARLAKDAGAARVRIAEVPDGAPEGWDLADEPPEGWTADTIEAALDAAAIFDPDGEMQGEFRVLYRRRGTDSAGLYKQIEIKDPDTGERIEEWSWFASRIDVEADTRNAEGEAWGRLLAIHDRDGTVHRWAMPMEMLAGSGEEFRRELYSRGMVLKSGGASRAWLADYLSSWRPRGRVRCVDTIGWHGRAFVLPDRSYGDTAGERVILQLTGTAPRFEVLGSLRGWQEEIAAPAVGNSRLMLALMAGFAGPLVYGAGEESGGFHFFGASSTGKTTALHVLRSVWGVALGSWRTTDNGAEGLARAACDTVLPLDEIGQASPQVVEALAYLLGNQRGKARMRRDGSARPASTWRLLFVSTGEMGLAARLAEGGKRAMAGQMVRAVEIPADAGAGLGLFEKLHGFADGAALAEHLRLAADRQCGHAGRTFLERFVRRAEHWSGIVRQARQQFVAEHCPTEADGQVKRVCGRFALLAAAGELAVELGVLPWARGQAERAAVRCFKDWLRQLGGIAAGEVVAGLRQVRLFIEQHGMARFEPAWANAQEATDAAAHAREPREVRILNRAGFRKADEQGNWSYYVLPESWAAEVCKGLNARQVAGSMLERGWLEPGDGKNLASHVRVPGLGKVRLYRIRAAFLTAEDATHADR